MEDLQGYSAFSSYPFDRDHIFLNNNDATAAADDEDSEIMIQQPPPQLPLLDPHQDEEEEAAFRARERELERSISLANSRLSANFRGANSYRHHNHQHQHQHNQLVSSNNSNKVSSTNYSSKSNISNPFGCSGRCSGATAAATGVSNGSRSSNSSKPTDGSASINHYDPQSYEDDSGHGRDSGDYDDEFKEEEEANAKNGPAASPFSKTAGQFQAASARTRSKVAISTPIQVPARRARKDFYSMRLNMIRMEQEAELALAEGAGLADDGMLADVSNTSSNATDCSETISAVVRRSDLNRSTIMENSPELSDEDDEDDDEDDDDEDVDVDDLDVDLDDSDVDENCADDDGSFLKREFNDNHYKHYHLDGVDDDEHLTASENPEKLFASIQALAKSIHEDAELFGSLPPKRHFVSPISHLAF